MKDDVKNIDLSAMSRSELEAFAMRESLEKEALAAKVSSYEEQLRLMRAQRFGKSSEKAVHPNQMQMFAFNEAEDTADPDIEEVPIEQAAPRRKKKKGARKEQIASLPLERIDYTLTPEEMICPECGGPLHDMTKKVRNEIIITPAKAEVKRHVTHEYACRNCEKNAIAVPIIKAKSPAPLIENSVASASLVATVLNNKYVLALPLYRQEEEFKRIGIGIPRQNLSNWVIKVSEDYFSRIYDALHHEIKKTDICHIDETTVEVLHEPGRRADQKSYMWLYRTGKHDEHPICLFDYKEGRSGDNPKAFMNGFRGFMHTDGYSGYGKMIDENKSPPDIIRVGCWGHARRKYDEALKALSEDQRRASTFANVGLEYCNRLFAFEREWAELSPNERLKERTLIATPIVDEYFKWVTETSEIALPGSLLGKALAYSINQKAFLLGYLLDGRLEISNNLAERTIKSFVIGRKNWLFSNTPRGADSSAIIYSVIESAKANGLIPYHYLEYLLTVMPGMDFSDDRAMSMLLPWSDTLPQNLRAADTK